MQITMFKLSFNRVIPNNVTNFYFSILTENNFSELFQWRKIALVVLQCNYRIRSICRCIYKYYIRYYIEMSDV